MIFPKLVVFHPSFQVPGGNKSSGGYKEPHSAVPASSVRTLPLWNAEFVLGGHAAGGSARNSHHSSCKGWGCLPSVVWAELMNFSFWRRNKPFFSRGAVVGFVCVWSLLYIFIYIKASKVMHVLVYLPWAQQRIAEMEWAALCVQTHRFICSSDSWGTCFGRKAEGLTTAWSSH